MIIAIDFDGTIVENKFPEVGKMLPGAKFYIEKLKEDGHQVIIWTCRSEKALDAAKEYLDENGIPYDYLNESIPENVAMYGSDTRKVYAHVYIDDKNLGGFPGWAQAYKDILLSQIEYINTIIDKNLKDIDVLQDKLVKFT